MSKIPLLREIEFQRPASRTLNSLVSSFPGAGLPAKIIEKEISEDERKKETSKDDMDFSTKFQYKTASLP